MRAFVLSVLPLVACATPALAQQAPPISSDVTFDEKGTLIATPVPEIVPIQFDLANIGADNNDPALDSSKDANAVSAVDEGEADPLITGGAALDSKYVFSDLYVQTNSPTAKVYAAVNLRDLGLSNCTADFFAAHGLTTKVGREVDLGASCSFLLAEGIEASLGISRYVLGGLTDITTLQGTLKAGAFDVGLTEYVVDGGEDDAAKIEVGYTLTPTKALTLRPLVVYEHGFGLPDLLAAGAEASYALTDRFSLTAAAYTPISGAGPRKTQAVVGVSFSF